MKPIRTQGNYLVVGPEGERVAAFALQDDAIEFAEPRSYTVQLHAQGNFLVLGPTGERIAAFAMESDAREFAEPRGYTVRQGGRRGSAREIQPSGLQGPHRAPKA